MAQTPYGPDREDENDYINDLYTNYPPAPMGGPTMPGGSSGEIEALLRLLNAGVGPQRPTDEQGQPRFNWPYSIRGNDPQELIQQLLMQQQPRGG